MSRPEKNNGENFPAYCVFVILHKQSNPEGGMTVWRGWVKMSKSRPGKKLSRTSQHIVFSLFYI